VTFALQGMGASKGVAIGRIYAVQRGRPEIIEHTLPDARIKPEIARFRRALNAAKAELRAVKTRIPVDTASDVSAFIDTHLLMLEDSALTSVPIELIKRRKCNAEWALKVQRDAVVSVFDAMDDEYLRTRKDDVDHVVSRILGRLLSRSRRHRDVRLGGRVVCSDDLTPADTVLMQHQGISAFVTEFGGPHSHTAILANSLGIPAVVGLHEARHYLRHDELVVVDGRQGVILVEPTPAMVRHYRRRQKAILGFHVSRQRLRTARAVTRDGAVVRLQANVELPTDIEAAVRAGAQGIGLYRTEFLFMNRTEPPGEDEQYETYAEVIRVLKGAPITVRTLDLGADKQVDGGRPGAPVTANPALGVRAVRLCLREPSLFIPQIRAILRASAHGPIRMMIPMLSNLQELAQVRTIVKQCARELEREGAAFDQAIPVGAMIEVPAAALCAEQFARKVDFLSIGTNDLIQYTLAIDRVDDEVSYLYDPMHPAVLRLIRTVIAAGGRSAIPIAMCGEMAGDARYTRLLLGMGLREFSVHANALLEVKQTINESDVGAIRPLTRRVMRTSVPSRRAALIEEINRLRS